MGYRREYGKEVDQGLLLKILHHLPGITEEKPWESSQDPTD